MYSDYQYEYFSDPSFFQAKSQQSAEEWKAVANLDQP